MDDLESSSGGACRTAHLLYRLREAHAYGGVMSTVRPLFYEGGKLFPHFARDASGCRITDINGKTFVDWVFSGGAVLLGYRRPEVEEAIRRQLANGPTVSFTTLAELELAEMLVESLPSVDSVAFGKNGSDGVTAAVRIARAATGKEVVLFSGFHGFHDWYAATGEGIRGVPRALRALAIPFPFNDAPALERLLEEHRDSVAAIVMEPVKHELPRAGYLEEVRALATRFGAVLIFDEVVTFLRLGTGGAQAYFGVAPDLTCVGKSLANGMPISAVGGRRELMRLFPEVGIGMTFQGEALSMAAAIATIGVVRSEPVADHLARAGERLRQEVSAEAARTGLPCALTGHPSRMTVSFAPVGEYPRDYLLGLFITECLQRGVITNGTFLPSHAHDEAALDQTCEAVTTSLRAVAQAVLERNVPAWTLPGQPRVEGYIDRASADDGVLRLDGWVLVDGDPASEIGFQMSDGRELKAEPTNRPDVVDALGRSPAATMCGFAGALPLAGGPVAILSIRTRTTSVRCSVRVNAPVADLANPVPIVAGGVLSL